MNQLLYDLSCLGRDLTSLWEEGQHSEIQATIERLWSAAYAVNRSWSGSCIGYHSNVYYQDFNPPPPGQNFSVEWGITGGPFGSTGKWMECDPEDVEQVVYERAGVSDDAVLTDFNNRAGATFERKRLTMLSILTTLEQRLNSDDFMSIMKSRVEDTTLSTLSALVSTLMPAGQLSTRDERAATQGTCIPRHYHILAKVMQTKETIDAIEQLRETVDSTRQHVVRAKPSTPQSTNDSRIVFIGHGRNQAWRVLKDFLEDRLGLEVEEFNRVSVAGKTTGERLAEMLETTGFAFLVMAGEDETASGGLLPRMNVVHELGLFQGRLGFGRAIILLEEGCAEFSNIHGLGQIRFPRSDITSAFEEIRRVLEREGISS